MTATKLQAVGVRVAASGKAALQAAAGRGMFSLVNAVEVMRIGYCRGTGCRRHGVADRSLANAASKPRGIVMERQELLCCKPGLRAGVNALQVARSAVGNSLPGVDMDCVQGYPASRRRQISDHHRTPAETRLARSRA